MAVALLFLLLGEKTAVALPPIADCASLAHASLGPNISILSAQETTTAAPLASGHGTGSFPGAACAAALAAVCPRNATRAKVGSPAAAAEVVECDSCAGRNQVALREAGCNAAAVQSWCTALLPAPGKCAFEDNMDVGQGDTVIAEIKGMVDEDKCCAACYANPKCVMAAILPAGGWGTGCWLKTGAGKTYTKTGVKICRTTRTPAPPPLPTLKVGYCLVKVLVQPAINIWVGLPSDGSYNGRFVALGGGGFVGSVGAPTKAVQRGYAGATTDTGHKGSSGSFGMLSPGVPNVQLQIGKLGNTISPTIQLAAVTWM